MSFISQHFKLLEEVFALEQELLLRRKIFSRHGVKYKYPPPYLHEAIELYTDVDFLKVRLKLLKNHILYTTDLLDKHKNKIDYEYERRKEKKWKWNFWSKIFRRH